MRWTASSRSALRSASIARGLLAHPLRAFGLGPPALAQVLHLEDDHVGHGRRPGARARR